MKAMVAETTGRWPERVDDEWTVGMLDDLPDDGLRYEIIDGILQVSPSPVPLHQHVVVQLILLLSAALPPGHKVFAAPLGWQPDRRTSLEPDVMVVPNDAIGAKNVYGTPLLVVEVASPSTARIDRLLKFSRYAEGGIAQYWIVDPGVPSIEVFDLVDRAYDRTAAATGTESVELSSPVPVVITPAQLVDMST